MKVRRLGVGLLGLAGATLAVVAWLGLAPASAAATSTIPTATASTAQVTVPGAAGSTTQITVPGATGTTVSPSAEGAETPSAPAPLSAPPGSGADTLLSPPPITHGNPATFAERYGSSYYSLTQADTTDSTTTDGALGAVTDALWSIVMLLVGFAITVVEWAFHLDLATVIAPTLHHITRTLTEIVFDPWVATIVVVGGAWLVWWGLVRRRVSVAGEGALWMLVALVAAVAFLAQPTSLLEGADHATSAIGTSALTALAPLAPAQANIDGATTPATAYAKGPASDAELRRAANTLWETYVYEPWLVAEFGSITAGKTSGPAWLALQSQGGAVAAEQADLAGTKAAATAASSGATAGATTATAGTGGATGKAGANGAETPTAESSATAKAGATGKVSTTATAKSGATATAQAWFAGSYPSGRFGVVLVAFMAAVALCGLLCALALAVLLAQVALMLLVALAPLFLLLGIHPGYGRRVALRWAELAIAAVLKRVVYSVALAAVLVIIGTLIDLMSAADVGWAITALLPTLALLALVLFRRRVSQALLGAGAGLARERLQSRPQPVARVSSTHAGAPQRVATHPLPASRQGAPAGGRPPWWAATRHSVRPGSPAPRSEASAAPKPDAWSQTPAEPQLAELNQAEHEPAPVP